MSGTEIENENGSSEVTVPQPRPEVGSACVLDGRLILTFRGDRGFFSEVETEKGLRFRVPAERVAPPSMDQRLAWIRGGE